MHYSCDFRCPYCFYTTTGWDELLKKNQYKTAEQWNEVWHRIYVKYGSCQIRITAGEPFTYPRFVDIVETLSKEHDLQITTNCSMPKVMKDFVQRANPRRVELDCTFHPLELTFDKFTDSVLLLRNAGFTANVCFLAYPLQMPQMLEYKRRFKERGIHMNMAIYWGPFGGKTYPHAFTAEEKKAIKEAIGYEVGPETVGLEPLSVKGKLCGAGQRYAVIHCDGKVFRCGQLGRDEECIGDILDPHFELFKEGQPCTADYCRSKEFQSAWEAEDKETLLQKGEIRK